MHSLLTEGNKTEQKEYADTHICQSSNLLCTGTMFFYASAFTPDREATNEQEANFCGKSRCKQLNIDKLHYRKQQKYLISSCTAMMMMG